MATTTKYEAFSKCGCLRGELYKGVITITKINEACSHNIDTVTMPQSAATDIASILLALRSGNIPAPKEENPET